MLQKIGNLFHDFRQLPLGFRAISVLVGSGGLLCIVFAFSSGPSAILPILLILLAVVVLFILVGWLARILAKRKGEGMGASLWALTNRKSQEEGFESRTDADAARKLRDRWQDVFQLLKEKGYDFYSLPWFLIIGPSQSGKTTLIQKSNQEFPIGEKPVADFGTKNCNWFFMNKAIILDTAGRYVEHLGEGESLVTAEDKQEWEDFLTLLLRFRSRSPINGLILVLKIPDILDPDSANRLRTAEILRKALLDIEEQLKIQCPVYIMVSMCDRLTGFTEFFSMLPGLSDRSLLGWSRGSQFDRPFGENEIGQGLQDVVGLLEKLRLSFLAEKSDQAAADPESGKELDRLFSFPDEFKGMLNPLQEILTTAFEPSAYHQGQFLRGVYFTSALQKGEPILGACLNLLGEQADSLVGNELVTTSGSKAFFIADFFAEKVFSEQGLVRLTSRAQRERKFKEKLALAIGAIAAVATLGWAAFSKIGLGGDVIEAGTALTEVRQQLDKDKPGGAPTITAKLVALNTRLRELQENAPALFSGNVAGKVRQIHRASLQTFAYRCFAPVVIDYLRTGKPAETWADGQRIGSNLTALLSLGRPLAVNGKVLADTVWLADLKRVLGELDLQRGQKKNGLYGQMEKIAGFEAIEDDPELPRYFAQFLGCPAVRSVVLARLHSWVLDPWVATLDQFTLAPDAVSPAWANLLASAENEAWRLDRLFSLDKRANTVFGELRGILAKMALSENWADGEKYNDLVAQPWHRAQNQFAGILKTRKAPGMDQPINDPEQLLEGRLEGFRKFKTTLEALPLFTGNEPGANAWREVKGSLRHLESRLVKRNEKIRGWIVGDQREHFLVRLTKPAAGGKEISGSPGSSDKFNVTFTSHQKLAADLDAFCQLVENDISQDLAPEKAQFWSLPGGIKEWREKKLAIFTKFAKAPKESEQPGMDLPPLVDSAKVKTVREGFSNRLDLAFYGRIHQLCRDPKERERVLLALGKLIDRSEIKEKKRIGLGWDAFPETGYAFTFNGIYKVLEFSSPIQEACKSEEPWTQYLKLDKDFNENFLHYMSRIKRFWEKELGQKIAAALPSLGNADGLSGGEELTRLTKWKEEFPPKVLLDGVAKILAYSGSQIPNEAWQQQLERFTGFYEFWKKYTDPKQQKLVLEKIRGLLRAVTEINKILASLDSADPEGPAKILTRANALKIHFSALQPLLEVPGETPFPDPVVTVFNEFGASLSRALGRIGGEIFVKHWSLVGKKAGKVRGRFPFSGKNLPRDEKGKLRLADWLETRHFFGQKDFRLLQRTVGDSVVDRPPLFSLAIDPTVKQCFRRCVLLARAIEHGKPIMINVKSGGERSVMHSKWNLQIMKGDQAEPEFSKGFSFQSLAEFQFPLHLDKYPRRIFLRAWEGEADWLSYHPMPPASQKSPWNFLAWLWLWSEFDPTSQRFSLRIKFPRVGEKLAATNGTINAEKWELRLNQKEVPYLKLSIKPLLELPGAPPDLGAAGWDS